MRGFEMSEVLLKQIEKKYNKDELAVKGINLEIKDKEFIVFVGPSGCGKSTTLRMIAGLEEISGGGLYFGDKLVNHIPSKDRDIAMVFQNYALYPHMTIYDNIAFSLKMKKKKKAEIDELVRSAAKILELEEYLDRKPAALSGGQRQRVALGRAMVRKPQVFLLDEPLSNLDAKLRVAMRTEIVKLHRKLQTTFIYVTHDQTEAMTMGDRIVVMRDGAIEQVDTPTNLYAFPETKFVAEFIGSPKMNLFETTIERTDNKITIQINGKEMILGKSVVNRLRRPLESGEKVYVGIRPEAFKVARMTDEQTLQVLVENTELMGSDTQVYFNIKETTLNARIEPSYIVEYGDMLHLQVDMDSVHLFDAETEETLLNRYE